MKNIFLILGLMISALFAQVDMTKPLKNIVISEDNGGYVIGGSWNSSMLKGKTTMLMYVDPDEQPKGEIFKPTIEAFERDLDFNKFQILVILNLNATWKPDFLIKSLVKDKVGDYPTRIYILDKNSILVKQWGLTDNEYNTLVINKQSKIIYSHSGIWKYGEIDKINLLIRAEIK